MSVEIPAQGQNLAWVDPYSLDSCIQQDVNPLNCPIIQPRMTVHFFPPVVNMPVELMISLYRLYF